MRQIRNTRKQGGMLRPESLDWATTTPTVQDPTVRDPRHEGRETNRDDQPITQRNRATTRPGERRRSN